jgi:hypothetical protein
MLHKPAMAREHRHVFGQCRVGGDDGAGVPARLVGEHAAIIGPGPPPGVLILVGLIAAPAHADRTQDELAESVGIERLAR